MGLEHRPDPGLGKLDEIEGRAVKEIQNPVIGVFPEA